MNGDSTRTVEVEKEADLTVYNGISSFSKKKPNEKDVDDATATVKKTKRLNSPKIKFLPHDHLDEKKNFRLKIVPLIAPQSPDGMKDPEVVHIIDSEDETVINDQSYRESEYQTEPDANSSSVLEKHPSTSYPVQESDLESTEDFNTSNDLHSSSEKEPDEELSHESSTIIAPVDIKTESIIEETCPASEF